MRGHIRKRSKNSWTIVLSLGRDPQTGKKKYQWQSVKGTKKQAEKVLADVLHRLDTGDFVKPTRRTVGDFLRQWLRDYAWPNLAPRTSESYEHIVNQHLIPSLGSLPLSQLTPQHLQQYYGEKLASGRLDGKAELSARTVRSHHTALHNALQSAVKWGLLSRNPADGVDPPRFSPHEIQTLDEADMHTLLEAARSTPYYALFYTALYTGMRRSELLALRWGDVDLDLAQISVIRTLHQLRDGALIFRPPKTAKARRMIALPPSAALVLREHKQNQEGLRILLGVPSQGDDLVFCQADGKPLLPNTVTHAWVRLVRRIGLTGVRLHDSRHSHATIMLKQGIHPKVVQERLGHAGIQITLDTYSHVVPGLQEAAAARFDEGLGNGSVTVKNGAFFKKD